MEAYFGERMISFPRRSLIMGIVNINDDSFSGDGSLDVEEIRQQCVQKIADGADVIDLGAESARTNRAPITEAEEWKRLERVLECWEDIVKSSKPRDGLQVWPPILSVNTWRPEVIRHVLSSPYGEQVGLINDMSALAYPETLSLLARSNASLLIMHSVGLPKEKHDQQEWVHMMDELTAFFTTKVALAVKAGIAQNRLIIDPGLDFAKQSTDSLKILKQAESLGRFEVPVLFPLSRKTFIGEALSIEAPENRDAGTVACLPFVSKMPSILRVHNVFATWSALRVLT